MKRRWKILIALAAFGILMGASLLITLHVQPDSELVSYQKLLRSKGEKLDLPELLPPPTDPESNSVEAVRSAFSLLDADYKIPFAMQMVAPGRAMIGWSQPDARSADFTNSWEEFGDRMQANQPALDLLHQVLERPVLDFQLDYRQGIKLPLPHLASLKRAAQKLAATAVYDLHNGDAAAATTNILIMLALVQRQGDCGDQTLIGHLVRIAIANIAVVPTWELLQTTNVTENQLAAIQDGWQQLDFLRSAEKSFTMERITTVMTIAKTRASHRDFEEVFGPTASSSISSSGGTSWSDILEDATAGPRQAAAEAAWRSSGSYSTERHVLEYDQVMLETLRSMQTNQTRFYWADYDAMVKRLSLLSHHDAGSAFFEALRIPDLGELCSPDGSLNSTVRRILQAETTRQVAITAIALKRYQLKHGQWPQTINDLVPGFLSAVPIDPYDGKPLKYHGNSDDTFLLYSVGDDGIDDGGDVTPAKTTTGSPPNWNWQRARDWVWPQPATPDEVQNFREYPPK